MEGGNRASMFDIPDAVNARFTEAAILAERRKYGDRPGETKNVSLERPEWQWV